MIHGTSNDRAMVPQDLPAGYMNTIFLDPSLLLTLQKALLAGNLRRITLRMPAL
jgi:hypothetical protein